MTRSDTAARLEALHSAGVRFVFAQFADLHGAVKGKLLPVAQLQTVLDTGAGFAGLSVPGFELPRYGRRSEYYGRGDPATLQVLPWQPDVARIVCDGFVGGQVWPGCPRQVLRRALAPLAARGWTLQVGIEPEFFLFDRAAAAAGHLRTPDPFDTLDKPSYDWRALTRPPVAGFLAGLHDALQALGFEVLQIDHEDAPGQYELNYAYGDALSAADRFMLFKMAAGAVAEAHGLLFSLMPKPFAERPGSGLHLHLSLTDAAGRNLFDDGAGGLSALGGHALAGLLAHGPALAAIHAPTVNSYKRLFAEGSRSGSTWAPATLTWGPDNRTTLARTVGNRIEWRLPDGSSNIYAVLATVAAAVEEGVARSLPLPPAHDADLQHAPSGTRLPASLGEALGALAADAVVREALGEAWLAGFMKAKQAEWEAYRCHVTDWERARYAAAL